MQERQSEQKTFKAAFSVTLIIVLSKCFGFLRDMILAARFGATPESDAYFMAYSMVTILAQIILVCVSSTFVPIYSKILLQRGSEAADRYTSNILSVFLVISVFFSSLALIFAGPLISLFAPGFEGSTYDMTLKLFRIMVPSLVFSAISALYSALLNARSRFVPAQLVGFPLSLFVILAALLFSSAYGITVIALATLVAMFFQIVVQYPFVRDIHHPRFKLRWKNRYVKQTFLLAGPAFISVLVNEINQLIDRSLASGLPEGSLTALNYGYKLLTLVHGVIIVAITTILFSRLSQYAARGDQVNLAKTVRSSNEIISLIVMPIIAISLVMGADIIRIVYQRGTFGAEAAEMTRNAFIFYIIGVLPLGMRDVLSRAFYSLQNTRIPMIHGAIGVAVNIGLNLLLIGPLGLKGLALATSAAFFVTMALLFFSLRRRLKHLGLVGMAGQLLLIAVASAACGGAAYLVSSLMASSGAFIRLACSSLAGLIVYALLVLFMRVDAVREGIRLLLRERKNAA
ncbi:MAG: murein biosynthesis integral membrane protein MurJ [Christensenellales bacterium]|jgi:putative peptidoglycan lipid II flippase